MADNEIIVGRSIVCLPDVRPNALYLIEDEVNGKYRLDKVLKRYGYPSAECRTHYVVEPNQYRMILIDNLDEPRIRCIPKTQLGSSNAKTIKELKDNLLLYSENIVNELEVLNNEMSPENLTCDGELSGSAVTSKKTAILTKWHLLELYLGCKVQFDF